MIVETVPLSQVTVTKKAKTRSRSKNPPIYNFKTAGNNAPLPNKFRTTLRYCQQVPLNSTTAPTAHTFALNGLFDPDISGVGHQPMGWDQLIALYQKAYVNKVKVNAWFVIETDTNTSPQYVGLSIHENSSFTPADVETIIERGRCAFSHLSTRDSGHSQARVGITWDAAKWYPKDSLGDTDYQNTAAANPAEICYVSAWAGPDFPAENPEPVSCMVIFDYDVTFLNPIQMNAS